MKDKEGHLKLYSYYTTMSADAKEKSTVGVEMSYTKKEH